MAEQVVDSSSEESSSGDSYDTEEEKDEEQKPPEVKRPEEMPIETAKFAAVDDDDFELGSKVTTKLEMIPQSAHKRS